MLSDLSWVVNLRNWHPMRSPVPLPICLTTIEQRFVRGPSLWSGQSCLVTLLDMGPQARALSTDFPGMGAQLLALFPAMHDDAEALRRGVFIAEVLGRIALELQRGGSAPPSRCALIVHGRQGQVRIIIAGHDEHLAVQAFAQATATLAALCAGVGPVLAGRSAGRARAARGQPSLHFIQGHAGEHGQHEHQGFLASVT